MIDNIVKGYLYKKKDEKQTVGIGGFNLDVRFDSSINFTMVAPENYVEDGSVTNDHIINDPITLSISGEVADIHIKPKFDDFVLETIREKVQFKVINTVLTKQQQQKIQSVVDKIQSVVKLANKGFDIYNRFNNRNKPISKVRTVQDDFFDFLESNYINKRLITIEMPFRNYENMLITSLTITKDNSTNQKLKYSLSAKEIRFAEIAYAKADIYFDKPTAKPTSTTKAKTTAKKDNAVVDTKDIPKESESNPLGVRAYNAGKGLFK